MIRFPVAKAPDKLLHMTDVNQAGKQAEKDVRIRSRTVKPGHMEIGEFTSGSVGASAPFGRSDFPLPVKDIYYEHPEANPPRILDEERR